MITAIPMASITPQRIVFYDYLEGLNKSATGKAKSLANLVQTDTGGKISPAARKRLTAGINWMHTLTTPKNVILPDTGKKLRFRLNMLTVTLSSKQQHSDNEVKKQLLNRLLEQLRDNEGMKAYVWRAEAQKNGNIHFHITTNIYIHHKELRDRWNTIQERFSYVSQFEEKNGHRDPNSTDVHSIYKVKNLAAYLCKYMAKDSEHRAIDGRQWFLSQSLSQIKPIQCVLDGQITRELQHFSKVNQSRLFQAERASVLFADIFTSNLSAYPELQALRARAFVDYQHLVQ